MNQLGRLWRCIPGAATGTWAIYLLIKNADSDSFIDDMLYFFVGFIGLLAFVWTLYRDRKEYRKTKSVKSFLPVFVCLFFVAGLFLEDFLLGQRDNSPVVLEASSDDCLLEFRKDGTYKLGYYSLVGANYYRGKYQVRDSIITIDRKSTDRVFSSNRFVIRQRNWYPDPKITTEKVLYQIDILGNITDQNLIFTITKDLRAVN